MVFKLDPVALVLDTFTFGCWSGYWNIQRITEYKYLDNINERGRTFTDPRRCPFRHITSKTPRPIRDV